MIIIQYMENKKCLKPPTSGYIYIYIIGKYGEIWGNDEKTMGD